eukprot:10666985-Alexandrium_andersonii.AAC.1
MGFATPQAAPAPVAAFSSRVRSFRSASASCSTHEAASCSAVAFARLRRARTKRALTALRRL